MKKKLLYSFSSISSFVLPLSIISCSQTIEQNNDQQIYNNLLDHYININKIGESFNGGLIKIKDQYNPYINDENISINEQNYVYTQANKLNMFKILLNEDWKYSQEKSLLLDSIFYINDLDVVSSDNKNFKLGFSFDYLTSDSFGSFTKPYISSNLDTIIIPVKVSLIEKETNKIMATKFVDMMLMKIINKTVGNFEDFGFDGQEGKSIVYPLTFTKETENNNVETIIKPIKFMDIPNIIIDPYLDLNTITSKNDSWKAKIIYNDKEISEWSGKSFMEVKSSISNAFLNPPDLVFKNKSFSYSMYEYSFDQQEWNYPRFTVELKESNQDSIINTESARKYELNFYKRYSYVDKSYKFSDPTESDINSAKEKNTKIATDLSSFASSNTFVWQPKETFSVEFIKKWSGEDGSLSEIVEMFNSGTQGFLPPAPFKYHIFDNEYRDVNFRIEKISLNSNVNTTFDVSVEIQVGAEKLVGSSTYTKKFNTKTWKWE